MFQNRLLHASLALALLAGAAGAQTGASVPGLLAPADPNSPFDPGPRRFGVRVEPREAFVSTAAHTFVNVPRAASSFVVEQDDTQVSATFSAEVYSTSSTGRVFVRALLDGQPMEPGSVVFARGDFDGVACFTFAGTVDEGIHSIEMQWSVDSTDEAFLRDGALLVLTGRNSGAASTLASKVPPSGPAVSTTSMGWTNVPGATLSFFAPASTSTVLSFSAEAFVASSTGGISERMFVRVLVDGAPAAPTSVVFTESTQPKARQMNFGLTGLEPGWHTARVQWSSAHGGHVYLGDRSLTASSARKSGLASQHFHSPQSGPTLVNSDPQWQPVPGLTSAPWVPANGELAISVSAEVKTEPGAVMELRVIDQGQIVSDTVVAFASRDAHFESRTFTFDAKHVFAPGGKGGPQSVVVQWRALQGTVFMGDRSIAVQVEPGDYPDLADGAPFSWVPLEPAIGTRKVLTILYNPNRQFPNHVEAPLAEVQEALYGAHGVRAYFEAMSGGRFTLENVGILDWEHCTHTEAYHWDDHQGCAGNSGYAGGHQERWIEALASAASMLDLAQYDTDHDDVLEAHELAILLVTPQVSAWGDKPVMPPLCDNTVPTFDGVSVPYFAEWFTSNPLESMEIAAHELAHVLLDVGDAYIEDENTWVEPGRLSLMGTNRYSTTHLDPFHKLALGWVRPIEVTHTGVLQIEDVKESGTVYVLPRRVGGDGREYFLLESRQNSDFHPKFDEEIIDSGIAVWQVIESSDQNLYAPECFDQVFWETVTTGDLRRGLRVIRPWFTDFTLQSLWKSSNYDLLNENPVCPEEDNELERRNVLRWADGTEAPWQLLNFSDPGPVMSVLVEKLF